jgi:hypothetical protein
LVFPSTLQTNLHYFVIVVSKPHPKTSCFICCLGAHSDIHIPDIMMNKINAMNIKYLFEMIRCTNHSNKNANKIMKWFY